MGLFGDIDTFEVGAFLFIFGVLAISMGSASSFGGQVLESGFATFLTIPYNILGALGASGSIILLAIGVVAFLIYFNATSILFGEAFWALVIFGYLAVWMHV